MRIYLPIFMSLVFVASAVSAEETIDFNQLQEQVRILDERYPQNSITDLKASTNALSEIEQTKIELRKWFKQAESACYKRFFVNICLENTKLDRRRQMHVLDRIAHEANAFNRQDRSSKVKVLNSDSLDVK